MNNQNFIKLSEEFFVDSDFAIPFHKYGLTTIDEVFNFTAGENLNKDNLSKHRSRLKFHLDELDTTLFLKRYDRPPILVQLKNWFAHLKRASTSSFDRMPSAELNPAGIKTPKIIGYGEQWGRVFEKRSFIITQKIPDAESLEHKLPDFFYRNPLLQNQKQRRGFINSLADFTRKFHETRFCHRDFYLAHIFMTDDGKFYLIDLQRTFKPGIFGNRFRRKDITQLYYSAPGEYFTRSDRLRFYLRYKNKSKLKWTDRLFFRLVQAKAWRMADHDIKHNRPVPFAM